MSKQEVDVFGPGSSVRTSFVMISLEFPIAWTGFWRSSPECSTGKTTFGIFDESTIAGLRNAEDLFVVGVVVNFDGLFPNSAVDGSAAVIGASDAVADVGDAVVDVGSGLSTDSYIFWAFWRADREMLTCLPTTKVKIK